MQKISVRLMAGVVLLAVVASMYAPVAQAQTATYTVIVQSAFLRPAPDLSQPRLYSVFFGESYTITGRTRDGKWARIDFPGATEECWLLINFGEITGDFASVPIATGSPKPVVPATPISNNPPPSAAPASARFTVDVQTLRVRAAPNLTANVRSLVAQGTVLNVRGRSNDSVWLLVDVPNLLGEAWVWAYGGTLNVTLASLPILIPGATGLPAAPTASAPSIGPANPLNFTAAALENARAIYQRGIKLGVNPKAFSRVGDSNSEDSSFLSDFDGGAYDLGDYGYLIEVLNYFSGSFRRTGSAVQGFTTWGVLDPLYADPRQCRKDESALKCELRQQKPGVVLIMIGTNDVWLNGSIPSEPYLTKIVQTVKDSGAVPVLSTFAWNPNSTYYASAGKVNDAIRSVAAAQNVPLWDFARSVQSLPNQGIGNYPWDPHAHLSEEPGNKPFTLRDPYLQAGKTFHNLQALQALHGVLKSIFQR